MKYEYLGKDGEFRLENPELYSYLYFPLANESGVMSSITPDLSGDSKINQNAFLMPPVSAENLHNDKSSRNIWCRIKNKGVWSLTGRSAWQQAELFSANKDQTVLEAGFMHHRIKRTLKSAGIQAEISSIVPSSGEMAELMKVEINNISKEPLEIQVVSAIPIYGRSAQNIRDHRHVTALLHRIQMTNTGVIVNPTMSFDERGHQQNNQVYGVFGGNSKEQPIGYYPVAEDFIGEGGSFENPKALHESTLSPILNPILKSIPQPTLNPTTNPIHPHISKPVDRYEEINGYEALGGLCFENRKLDPSEKSVYIFVMAYGNDAEKLEETAGKFLKEKEFDKCWEETKSYWNKKVNISYETCSPEFDQWMRWVNFQPMLRRIFGCSFLPHHDYGKGGRGWRDLWQDCLALLMMNPDGVRQMLIDNFGGVRIDGTNATIIGSGQGEFIADRNNITRVWMDHGVWPFLTTELYIQQTGDIQVLLEESPYFKDMQVCRGEEKDLKWSNRRADSKKLVDSKKRIYTGTILEHLLVQHLTAFYDVGKHNHIKIRGADWNDALDLAAENGESVAFTTMYAKNMEQIAALLKELKKSGIDAVEIAKEIEVLLCDSEEVYNNVKTKQLILSHYCQTCMHSITGEKSSIPIDKLQNNLISKSKWMKKHIRNKEWICTKEGHGWYNGYYDNAGKKVEGETSSGVRMMLTSQVFAIMSGTASEEQIWQITESADKYLYNAAIGGYRLNTDFREIKMDLGRMFGFAYGHKENGAVFSHMTIMYANALYARGASKQAYKVIQTLFEHCSDFEQSKIYPGVPEYIDAKGRGVYHYLTGAASWLLVTVLSQMFGIRGDMGSLTFHPQLLGTQFDGQGKAAVRMLFAGRKLYIRYTNVKLSDPEGYQVKKICLNGREYKCADTPMCILRKDILVLPEDKEHVIDIELF